MRVWYPQFGFVQEKPVPIQPQSKEFTNGELALLLKNNFNKAQRELSWTCADNEFEIWLKVADLLLKRVKIHPQWGLQEKALSVPPHPLAEWITKQLVTIDPDDEMEFPSEAIPELLEKVKQWQT